MQKTALMVESVLLALMVVLVLWQRHDRTFKCWWQAWRANPRQTRQLRPRTPEDHRKVIGMPILKGLHHDYQWAA